MTQTNTKTTKTTNQRKEVKTDSNDLSKIQKNIKEEIEELELEEEDDEEEVEVLEGDDNEEVSEAELDADDDKKKLKKQDFVFTSHEEAWLKLTEIRSEILKLERGQASVLKQYNKLVTKRLKQTNKRRNVSDTPKEPTGFIKATEVPDKFKEFFNKHIKSDYPEFNINENQPRTSITKMIYAYVRKNDLYEKKDDDTSNKRVIMPDDILKKLFSMNTDEIITFNNFQTYMCRMYNSDDKDEAADEEADEEVVDEEVEQKKVVQKSKSKTLTA